MFCKVFQKIKRKWKDLKKDAPGKRFQKRYYHRLKNKGNHSYLSKTFSILSGILMIFLGIILFVTPGPGWIVVFFGAGILAGQSLLIAKFLDAVELKLRMVWQFCEKYMRTLWNIVRKSKISGKKTK